MTLKQLEDVITDLIQSGPDETGEKEVEAQRNFISGYIAGLFDCQKITEEVRAICHAVYVEGWDYYFAVEQFAPDLLVMRP